MNGNTQPTWELVRQAAEKLTASGQAPFKLEQLIELVQRQDPTRARSSIQPIVQGMTANAGRGPVSRVGKILRRESRGFYSIVKSPPRAGKTSGAPRPGAKRIRMLTVGEGRARIDGLCTRFEESVREFDRAPAFSRPAKLKEHQRAIHRRYELGSVEAAVHDSEFTRALRATLAAWGLNQRASRLVPVAEFNAGLRRHAGQLANLEALRLEELPAADVPEIGEQVYRLITQLKVVESEARIVAGTKALHHLLPDLVPPMDRAWTGSFLGWATWDPQNNQKSIFLEAFAAFAEIARRTTPSHYVGEQWRTCPTKVLDNAVIGYCRLNRLGPTADGVAIGTGVAAIPIQSALETNDDMSLDEPLPGLDQNHPCPMCGAAPLGPGDGFGRICLQCGWVWMIGEEGGHYDPEVKQRFRS